MGSGTGVRFKGAKHKLISVGPRGTGDCTIKLQAINASYRNAVLLGGFRHLHT